MDKPDALAIIDLAEACTMFYEDQPRNYKAAGICYNNIGNIQYKIGHYDQAADNFNQAVECATRCLIEMEDEKNKSFLRKKNKKFTPCNINRLKKR